MIGATVGGVIIAVLFSAALAAAVYLVLSIIQWHMPTTKSRSLPQSPAGDILTLAPPHPQLPNAAIALLAPAWGETSAQTILDRTPLEMDQDLLAILGDTDYDNQARHEIGEAVRQVLLEYQPA